MSQLKLNSLTTFLNTSFKTLLAVTAICLSAVVANAAELAPENQDKITSKATVIVTGKNYTYNLATNVTGEIEMTKLVSFKTPKNMAGLDKPCEITINFSNAINAAKTATIKFTLPLGWKNTAEENKNIDATLTPDIEGGITTFKFNAVAGSDAIKVLWEEESSTSEDNKFTEFVAGKTVKVDGQDKVTTGGVITIKVPAASMPIDAPFTVTNASFVVKDIIKDSDKVIGEFKLSFKNDKDFADIKSVILTATSTEIKLFTDKKLTTPFAEETFTKKDNEFYPNFEKTLYFKVDSIFINNNLTYKGLTPLVQFKVAENVQTEQIAKTVPTNVIITKTETNYATLKLSKTELKDIKVKTDIVGTIEFKNKLAADVTYDLAGTKDVSGVTFDPAKITVKKDQKKATFKVTFDPTTIATNFTITATTTASEAQAAKIFDDGVILTEKVKVSTFKEVNGFVDATKDVTVTLKKDLVVRIPFKFQKPVKNDVKVKISAQDKPLEGTDFTDKEITVAANKNSFFVDVKITDITKFDGMGSETVFTAKVLANDPSGLQTDMSTTNTLITTDLVSKFLTAALSWTVEGSAPSTTQSKATSAIPAGSKIKLIVTMSSDMDKIKDADLKKLVTNALSTDKPVPFLVKFDKNAEMALNKNEVNLNVPLKAPKESDEMTNSYCASKKLKATVTISTTTKGIKILNKKATFLIGDDLDLDPFAATTGDYSASDFTLVSKNTYTSVDDTTNFEVSAKKLVFKGDKQDPTVINTIAKTATKSANIKMYVGTGVAKDEIYTAEKTDFLDNSDSNLITVAPALSFYVCDPITNPNELKPAKKIALKTAKGKDFINKASDTIDYTITSAPIVYNKKELANYRKAGKLFSALDPLTDTMIQPKQGFVGGTVKMAWKQGKKNEAGYIDVKESQDISVVVFAPATIAKITGDSLKNASETTVAFDFSKNDAMVLIDADNVVIEGKFLTAKTTLSAEYLDGKTVKVVSFKFGKDDVTFDATSGKISYKINKTTAKAFAKLKDKEFYLILDNGSALTSPDKTFKFGDKFFN